MLPDSLDKLVTWVIHKCVGATHGTTNTDVLVQARFHSLFRGRIRSLDINYPQGFKRGIGGSIAGFPASGELQGNDHAGIGYSDEGALDEIFVATSQMSQLQTLYLSGGVGDRRESEKAQWLI